MGAIHLNWRCECAYERLAGGACGVALGPSGKDIVCLVSLSIYCRATPIRIDSIILSSTRAYTDIAVCSPVDPHFCDEMGDSG